jgi:hypothetical protein
VLLPDLDQATPRNISVQTNAAGQSVLAFESAAGNIGSGPLLVEGKRRGSRPVMEATQRIRLRGGHSVIRRHAGVLRYAVEPDHSHWHYLRAMSYDLTTLSGRRVGRDRKAGFCLGDRYETNPDRRLRGEPSIPIWTGRCGLNRPDLRRVREGISVGYSDNYLPTIEGQYIDITGLPAGPYVLVHRVNPDHRLREENYSNNAASVLLDLRPAGAPPRILKRCPGSSRCVP